MKAVILAAGVGSRLRPLTDAIPKVMVPIGGKPLLALHIEHMRRFGIHEVFINLHHKHRIIRSFLGDGSAYGVKVRYSHETVLLGTAGALRPFARYLNTIFVLQYGDVFTTIDFARMEAFHRGRNAIVTASVHLTDHPGDSDVVLLTKENKVRKLFIRPHTITPSTNLGLAGIYLCEPAVIHYVPRDRPSDFARDVLPVIQRTHSRVYGYKTSELMRDIGTPDRLAAVQNRLLSL